MLACTCRRRNAFRPKNFSPSTILTRFAPLRETPRFFNVPEIVMKKPLLSAVLTGMFATAAHAQSSVTLYGVIDAGLSYVSNQKEAGSSAGHSNFAMTNYSTTPDLFGLRGSEDLGGGLKAIFTLENAFRQLRNQRALPSVAGIHCHRFVHVHGRQLQPRGRFEPEVEPSQPDVGLRTVQAY